MEKYGRNHVSSVVLEEISFFRKKPNPGWLQLKVCLVVIVFICSNCTSVHNLMVGKLIFRTARLFWGMSKFFSRIGKKLQGRGQKLGRVA